MARRGDRPRWLGAALVLGLVGCDGLIDLPDFGVAPPDMMIVHTFVAGEWQITGSGQFEECASPFSEAEFDLRSLIFAVEQADDGRLAASVMPGGAPFAFEDGRVIGTQVGFVTEEATDRGPIRLVYDGEVDALSNIRGTFEGIGPDACLSRGRFTVRVDLAERPLPPDLGPPDMGPADAASDAAGDAMHDSAVDGGAFDGALPDGALPDGALPDGALPDGG